MKTTIKHTILLASVLMLAACNKESSVATRERDITYTVTSVGTQHAASVVDKTVTVHLATEAEWQALLDRFCDYAEGGSTVTFRNTQSSTKSAAKEATTYSTTDREAMRRWMTRMEDEGKTVTVSYDAASGTWNGTAYATAPRTANPFDLRGATLSLFTVSWEGRRIHFSRGNLQYRPANNTWRFSDNQYSFHDDNGDWTDIFTWEQNDTMPWKAGVDTAFAGLTGQWRILNEEEWRWMLEYRQCSTVGTTENARWAPISVGGVRGLMLFPDNYNHPASVTLPVDINRVKSTSWDENDYSFGEWSLMEVAGAVFLPMAGYIKNDTTMYSNAKGRYWVYVDPSWFGLTALAIDTDLIPSLGGPEVGIIGWWSDMGASVRLVCSE